MKTISQIRQRHEQSRRTILLKKCRFYEYLIDYGGPINSFTPSSESKTANKNLTNTVFLPNSPKETNQKHSTAESMVLSSSLFETDETVQEKMISTTQDFKCSSNRIKEAFRPVKKAVVMNIDQLVAKAMTPSIRIKKTTKTIEKDRSLTIGEASLDVRCNKTCRSINPSRRLSYKKTINLREKFESPSSEFNAHTKTFKQRKQSISPWEVDPFLQR